jgi:hypothetical protein
MQVFIEKLDIPDQAKQELIKLTPRSYTGYAVGCPKQAFAKIATPRSSVWYWTCWPWFKKTQISII